MYFESKEEKNKKIDREYKRDMLLLNTILATIFILCALLGFTMVTLNEKYEELQKTQEVKVHLNISKTAE